MKKYVVIEDNGGGLHLATFDNNGRCDYIHSHYEYISGQLLKDLDSLKHGANPVNEWDGNCGGLDWEYGSDPDELYENLVSFEYGHEIVADNDGIYPEKMGFTASLEFGVQR